MAEAFWPSFRGKLLVSVATAPLAGGVSYVAQRALAAWGVLDGLADAAGRFLKPEAIGWTAMAVIALLLYGAALWLIWRSKRPQREFAFPPADPLGGIDPNSMLGRVLTMPEKRLDLNRRDASVGQAATWINTFEWGDTVYVRRDSRDIDPYVKALGDIRQAALDGQITVWGRPAPEGMFEKVEATFWRDHYVEPTTVFDPDSGQPSNTNCIHPRGSTTYYDLMVNRREVEREWPALA